MWEWIKKWCPIQFRWGDLAEKEKDVKVKAFVVKIGRIDLGSVIYLDNPEAEGE